MKKFLLFLQSLLICFVFIGCSADSEDNVMSDIQKVENAKLKIMEMANDYELNVFVNETLLQDKCSDDSYIENLNNLFASLSKIRGRYMLISESGTNNLKQNTKKTRKSYLNYAGESYKSYEFSDTTLIGDKYSFTCGCEVNWVDNYENPEVIGDVSCGQMIQGYCESDITTEVKEGRIYFEGKVTYYPSGTLSIYFYVSGWCTEYEGEIEWY